MIRALAITVSNRAAAGVYEDRSGPVLVEARRQAGCDVVGGPLVGPAGEAVGVPRALLSRGLAGIASRTLIVNLPGSSGGVRDGMIVLRQILVHAVDQIRGGDPPRSDR